MKKFTSILFLFLFIHFAGISQSVGDTITVQSFDYSSQTRDTTIQFPTNPTIKYEKILMLYNMRCKNGLVSTGTNRNLGCGEWDYSCNTYLFDSTRFDSTSHTATSYTISNFTDTSFNYSSTPLYDFYRKIETKTTATVTSEDVDTIGTGSISSPLVIPTEKHTGKSQFIYTAAELLSAGITTGNIDALFLDVSSLGTNINQFKIKMKPTTKSVLTADSIDFTGFTEVYFNTTTLVSGINKFQFNTPFIWDGTSNIIIEFSFNGNRTGSNNQVNCNAYTNGGLVSMGDYSFQFDRSNYAESNTYKGVGGSTNRTMEAWIKTTTQNGEILSWGRNATGEKWNWRTTNNGYLRIEINGNGVVGGTNVADGNWHHVAAVLTGNKLSDIQFYVDGNLDTKTANPSNAINTDAANGIKVQVNKGIHNRYLVGDMDNLRVWNTNLSQATLNEWKRKKIASSHPNFANLEMDYRANEKGSAFLFDSSSTASNGTIFGSRNWTSIQGEKLFKEITELNIRPNIQLAQGVYTLSNVNDTVFDSIVKYTHYIQENQIIYHPGQPRDDDINASNTYNYWNADTDSYFYDELGNVYDTLSNTASGTFTITNLPYQKRFPTKFEIMSFVTPYGIGLNLGNEGKTWVFDVTDYTPFLNGKKRITMERGGQWQEEMDIKFLFIVGTPEREVLDIREIWPVGYHGYNDIIADKYFAPRKTHLLDSGKYFNVKTAITGHGQEGEFIPRSHFFKVGPTQQFSWQVWKSCGNNPVYPQGGTWIYDRAGWCPGMATDIKNMDITSYVTAGDTAEFDYSVTTASGTSNYIVSNKLITYGEYNHNLDASIVDVVSPSKRVEYGRENAICHYPKITIRNSGKTTLTSLKIEYWVNNDPTKQTFNWTGNLEPTEQEVVQMHALSSMWKTVTGSGDVFHAEISKPNGGSDEYSYNNTYSSEFDVPGFLPNEFRIDYRSNNAASETSFKLYDEFGTVLHSNSGQANNTLSQATFNLGLGCYRLVVTDTDGDGIGFWANSDGNGYLRFQRLVGPVLFTIQPDFGSTYTYNFTIGSPLSIEDKNQELIVNLFPNPTTGNFTIHGNDLAKAKVTLINSIGQVIGTNVTINDNFIEVETNKLASGIYSVRIEKGNKFTVKKLIVN